MLRGPTQYMACENGKKIRKKKRKKINIRALGTWYVWGPRG